MTLLLVDFLCGGISRFFERRGTCSFFREKRNTGCGSQRLLRPRKGASHPAGRCPNLGSLLGSLGASSPWFVAGRGGVETPLSPSGPAERPAHSGLCRNSKMITTALRRRMALRPKEKQQTFHPCCAFSDALLTPQYSIVRPARKAEDFCRRSGKVGENPLRAGAFLQLSHGKISKKVYNIEVRQTLCP